MGKSGYLSVVLIGTSMMDGIRLASLVLPVFLGRMNVERQPRPPLMSLGYIDIQDERGPFWRTYSARDYSVGTNRFSSSKTNSSR